MQFKDFLEAIQYRITSGDEYGWQCFGPNARWLNSDDLDRYGAAVVYDCEDQTIYAAEISDYVRNRAYRWIHPEYVEEHKQEANQKGVRPNQAWDNVNWIDLDVPEDFLFKCSAVVEGRDYDARVSVPIDLEDEELFALMKMAHDRDITFNALVEEILWKVVRKEQGVSK